jgi:hypothetical protein
MHGVWGEHFEASLGPEHPHTVLVRQNLAVLLAGR